MRYDNNGHLVSLYEMGQSYFEYYDRNKNLICGGMATNPEGIFDEYYDGNRDDITSAKYDKIYQDFVKQDDINDYLTNYAILR